MKRELLSNVKSGFLVSLIALPLCLGIAIASGFPPIAGIMTAIVGGIIASIIGGCELSIKGPAAGMIVIVLACISELGYKGALAVGVIASLVQIIFAFLKLSKFGRLIPSSVIHGMLAAIGVIIMAKQIHMLMGVVPVGKSTLQLILEVPSSIMHINPELLLIGFISLFIMLLWPLMNNNLLKSIPPALIVLLIVVPLGLLWQLDKAHVYQFLHHDFLVGPNFLVNIPENILSSFVLPDFSVLNNPQAYKHIAMYALVGSIESVLTVIAIDSIVKNKSSDLNRDLLGIGVCNFLSAMIGGLPMISEVVRSKANIDNGATSKWSNFFHGIFLLLAISLIAPVIREIPLACLAAMLIITGFRLASPKQIKHVYQTGKDELLIFLTTLTITLSFDLLMGVMSGIAMKILFYAIQTIKLRNA